VRRGAAFAAVMALAAPTVAIGGTGHGTPMDHGGGAGRGVAVAVGYASYDPARIDVLAGDTVTWSNDSVRKHTVTADDGAWSSAELVAGARFARRFDVAGAVPYYCRLHAGMRGEVDVAQLLLDPLPGPGAPDRPYVVAGRAALPPGAAVTIEADAGAGFHPLGAATVADDHSFRATIVPPTTVTLRATAADAASPPAQLLVLDRTLVARAHARAHGAVVVTTHVVPASPGALVVLELRLRERFGWWPAQRRRLDARSRARFTLRPGHRVHARVLLTLPDGATALAVSGRLAIDPRR